ncbi:MAG: peptidylprolyl isomerase [Sphingomonadales bacterium]
MKFLTALMAVLAVASPAFAKKKDPVPVTPVVVPEPAATPDNLWHIQLSTGGEVVVQLRPDKAPNHVARIKTLTRAGFYDGLLFHRVIDGFMAQTGDPQGTGQGGSSLPDLKSEFNDMPHLRGTASMARATDPNSANSQFFITFMPVFRLDNTYTAFGRAVSGMNFVDAIERGEPPANPAKIVKAWIEADGPNAPKVPLPMVSVTTPPPAAAPATPATTTPPPPGK